MRMFIAIAATLIAASAIDGTQSAAASRPLSLVRAIWRPGRHQLLLRDPGAVPGGDFRQRRLLRSEQLLRRPPRGDAGRRAPRLALTGRPDVLAALNPPHRRCIRCAGLDAVGRHAGSGPGKCILFAELMHGPAAMAAGRMV